MRLYVSKSKNAESFYIIRSVYQKGKRTTVVHERLGTLEQVRARAGGMDPYVWAKAYAAELTRIEQEEREGLIQIMLSGDKPIDPDRKLSYEVGYVFLQKLFYRMGWNKLSAKIKAGTDSELPLNAILQMLLYTRVLHPASKKASWEIYDGFLPGARMEKIELHQVYRALDVIAEHSDDIQAFVYKSTEAYSKRNTDVLYYDCTNFFFETDTEDELRRYGRSKENRPLPLVQMGMFIDGDGIPLAVTVFPGNQSEQGSLKPLEAKILKDFELSRFIVCTDAGLASEANRRFNSRADRRYVVTQSLKTLAEPVQAWALEPMGWLLEGDRFGRTYDLRQIDEAACADRLFYKEQIVQVGKLTQRMVVTYSVTARNYQRSVRERQIARAVKTIEKQPQDMERKRPNDYRRLISSGYFTDSGEASSIRTLRLDTEAIAREEKYDGFYAVCSNLLPPGLNGEPADADGQGVSDSFGTATSEEILRINHMRWQIERCFRDMKTEFKSRPVYLSKENRIKAHFLLCSLSLILYKYLEKALRDASFTDFTTERLLTDLRSLTLAYLPGYGYIPAYNPSDILTTLMDTFHLPLNRQIISERTMKSLLAVSPKS